MEAIMEKAIVPQKDYRQELIEKHNMKVKITNTIFQGVRYAHDDMR
jgi:hypothetical protein